MTDRRCEVQRRRRTKETKTGEYQSGQMGQTVNLLVYTFGGSNPSSPTSRLKRKNRSLWKSGFEASERRRRELPHGNDRQMREAQRKRRLSETRKCGSSSVGRALAFQAKGRGFEPRLPLKLRQCSSGVPLKLRQCSSGVERFLGKEEVESSNLSTGSAFFCI